LREKSWLRTDIWRIICTKMVSVAMGIDEIIKRVIIIILFIVGNIRS
jgi:hypothetical protein